MLSLGIEDIILIYLQGYGGEFKDEDEVPIGLTARGIIKIIGLNEKGPYNTLKDLEEENLIEEDTKKIIGLDKERNVYFLTEKGKEKEKERWNELKDKKVVLKTEDDEKKLTLHNIKSHIFGRNPIVKGLRMMDENGVIDLTEFESEKEIFAGRQEELQELRKQLKKVKKGETILVLIEGEAGIGKTSLVSRLKPFASELGFKFLTGTCQSETSDPYLPFKEAFNEYIEGKSETLEKMGMAFMGADLGNKIEDKKLFDVKKKETFHETTKNVEQIAKENPLVVFLDDLQWVDRATLDILTYMNDKLEEGSILFIGTYRPEDIQEDHHLLDMMHRLRPKERFKKIELEPLDYEATEETVKGVLGTEEVPQRFIKDIHEKTKGNPLFIKEGIREMKEDGFIDLKNNTYPTRSDDIYVSDMVHNVIKKRVNRLDDETRKVLEIGSVIGGEIPFDLLSSIVEMDDIDLLDHIDILIENQIWEEYPYDEAFYFSHDLIKDTVYQDIKGLKKKLLHRRVAKNIEEIYKDEIDDRFSILARQYKKAERPSKSLDYYIKAGKRAEEIYANEDAVTMYEKAMRLYEETDDEAIDLVEILKNSGRGYFLLGRFEKTIENLEKALDIAEDKKEILTIYLRLAETYHEKGEWDTTLEYINKGLELCDQEIPEKCELISLKGSAYMKKGDFERAEKIFEEEKRLAEKIGDEEKIGQVNHDLGTAYFRQGRLDEGINRLKKAIDIRERNDNLIELYKSLNNIAIGYKDMGDYDRAREHFEKSLGVAKNNNFKTGIPTSLNNLAFLYSEMGDLESSIEKYKESLELSRKLGIKETVGLSLGNLGNVYLKRGELKKARENIDDSIKVMEEIGYDYGKLVDLQYLGSLNKKEGKMERAKKAYLESLEMARDIGSKKREAMSLKRLGEFFTTLGELDKAEKYYEDARDTSQKIGAEDIQALINDRLAGLCCIRG
ncbi:MAG: tetratricopeptide repeat protein, partial [Candidatus Natronoplasma sp.]